MERWPHGYRKGPRSLCALSVRHARRGQFPRRERGAIIFTGSTPELYGHWLQTIVPAAPVSASSS